MRLTAFKSTELPLEFIQDLSKLNLPIKAEELTNWLASASQVWLATFNDKALALALVDDDFALTYFCVREITRRRGVGKHLLQTIIKSLPENVQLTEQQSQTLTDQELQIWQLFWAECS